MTYEEMGSAAQTLLAHAQALSGGDREIGIEMLLLAAAAIMPTRDAFIGLANQLWDELREAAGQ